MTHYSRSKALLVSTVTALAVLTPAIAAADVLTFIHTGNGSGTLNGVPFPASNFTITSTGDTNNRQSFGSGWFIDHSSSSINIQGVGNLTVLTPTRTFVNNPGQIVGYSRAGSNGADLYNGPTNAVFGTWDMLGPIGPIAGTASLLQWQLNPQINTSGGILIFNNGTSPATFQAIPEPASAVLVGLGALAGLLRRRA